MASPEKVKERMLGKSTWVEVDVNNTNETLVSSRGSRDDPQVSQVSVFDSRILFTLVLDLKQRTCCNMCFIRTPELLLLFPPPPPLPVTKQFIELPGGS